MGKYYKILEELKLIAQDIEPVNSARIAAAIVHKRKIVGIGVCSRKSDPLQAKFGKVPEAIYLHAEIDAIKNSIRRMQNISFLRESVMCIARVRIIDGKFQEALAKPCIGCQRAIASFGIKDVYWTINERNTDQVPTTAH